VYIGIDFLLTPEKPPIAATPHLLEVNIGLPGGAQEYDLVHQVYKGRSSGVFEVIESSSREAYGLAFGDYLHSLPFIGPLKALKLWMDGYGPLPAEIHSALRLEDKWVQYQILSPRFRMPRTMPWDPAGTNVPADVFFESLRGRPAVLKRRTGRGGRGLALIDGPQALPSAPPDPWPRMLQERLESRLEGFSVSIRAVAFAGRFVAAYANLAPRPTSNHGFLAFVAPGDSFRLEKPDLELHAFDQRSWEAAVWFGPDPSADPPHLRHNLNEDQVASTALIVPADVLNEIRTVSVEVERLYEGLDFNALPRAWFDLEGSSPGPL